MIASVKQVPVPTAEGVSPELEARVMSFVRGPGWDGYHAKAVKEQTCAEAVSLLSRIRSEMPSVPDPRAAPATSGAVALYWRSRDEHLTLRVSGGRRERLTCERKRTGEAAQERPCTEEDALRMLSELFDGV
jgi:uncharacterized protein YfaQ (DUF2300 family)